MIPRVTKSAKAPSCVVPRAIRPGSSRIIHSVQSQTVIEGSIIYSGIVKVMGRVCLRSNLPVMCLTFILQTAVVAAVCVFDLVTNLRVDIGSRVAGNMSCTPPFVVGATDRLNVTVSKPEGQAKFDRACFASLSD